MPGTPFKPGDPIPADGGPTDVDGKPPGNWGAWETTGIVDASKAFGPDMFLINVQAHTLWVEKAPGDDNNGDGQPDEVLGGATMDYGTRPIPYLMNAFAYDDAKRLATYTVNAHIVGPQGDVDRVVDGGN